MKTIYDYIVEKANFIVKKHVQKVFPHISQQQGGDMDDTFKIEIYLNGSYNDTLYFFFDDLIEGDINLDNLPDFIKYVLDNKKIFKVDSKKVKGNSDDLTKIRPAAYHHKAGGGSICLFEYDYATNKYKKFVSPMNKVWGVKEDNYKGFENKKLTKFMEQTNIPDELL